tara:strand:+ start:9229 stop:9465 length:237 start_codon:yes stop_codon:yes gene_type:complete
MNIAEIINLYGPLTWPDYVLVPIGLLTFYGLWRMESYNKYKYIDWDKFAEEQNQLMASYEKEKLLEKANEIKERDNNE